MRVSTEWPETCNMVQMKKLEQKSAGIRDGEVIRKERKENGDDTSFHFKCSVLLENTPFFDCLFVCLWGSFWLFVWGLFVR